MFKSLAMLAIKAARDYHHNMVTYMTIKEIKCRDAGYSGMRYEAKAWKHMYKELKLSIKLNNLKGH